MCDENTIEPCYRYLMAIGLVKDDLIEKGCRYEFSKKQSEKYENSIEEFLNRPKAINEIAVYTTYAYADFAVPRKYDILFDDDNVDDFVETPFILEYSLINIAVFLYLNQTIGHGHKHVCILNFEREVPSILRELPDIKEIERDNKRICFCQKADFAVICKNIKQNRQEKNHA